ncbi:MAG: phasin family protein [Fluviicoccus sp.]|uniref:phasin family protein n=1 Tax=Fluviicoccus sp. TaxID=2003552 RepID=UPI0027181EB5|nr:phasin family protein [Fluviicoccus sp.]MDO8330131.1 phasin family protein [Fluviicoccus sp.]
MNPDFLANFNEQARKMAEPLAKMNQVMLKNAERMTEFSLNTIKNYSELGLNHLRHAAEVKTPEAATDFSAKQTELVNTISQQILQDAQRLTELGNAMRNDLLEVMGDSYTQATTEMQAAMNPTAAEAKPAAAEKPAKAPKSA